MRLSVSGAVFAVFLSVLALTPVVNAGQPIKISAITYFKSGLPNDFPATFVFRNTGELLFVSLSGDKNDVLKTFISSDGAQLPKPQPILAQEKTQLKSLMDVNGTPLAGLISPAHEFTVINLEIGQTLGQCGPCAARHKLVIDDVATSHQKLNAAYVVVALENP